MRKWRSRRLLLLPLLLVAPDVRGGAGTEFWAVASNGGHDLSVIIGNPDASRTAAVTIETETGPVASGPVAPGETREFNLGRARLVSGSMRARLAYRVTSDVPVHAYQFMEFAARLASPSSSVLVDRSRFGTYHLVMAAPAGSDALRPSVVTVVAPGPARVTVVPSSDVDAGIGVPAMAAGVPVAFDLLAHDVLQLGSPPPGDLTGTEVTSDAPVEVFAGCHGCQLDVPLPSAADDVQEWMLPVARWGTSYHAVTSYPMTLDTNQWRILASADGTTVTTDPAQPGTPAVLDRGEHLDLWLAGDFAISATAPVIAARFTTGGPGGGEGGSDPSMSLLLPPELFPTGAVFALPNGFSVFVDWVDVVAPPGADVRVDGASIPSGDFTPIGSSGYQHAQVRLSNATATHLVDSDLPVGIYAGHACCAQAASFPAAIAFPSDLAPICDAGGPYSVACTGPTTAIPVSGAGSSDPEAKPLTFAWSSPSSSLTFDDSTIVTPVVTVAGLGTLPLDLEVSDGVNLTRCSTTVTTTGAATTPPELSRSGPPLWLVKRGTDLLFSYEDLGGVPMAYNVYEGTVGMYYSHVALACSKPGGTSSPGRRETRLAPGAGSRYYLMSASSCFAEGPTGADPAREICPP